ncbi:MAG TPA: bacillithiol biosynthesis cysteine-adding enzyme BshC [Flavitalea sp.]|nr:bacillithiol biosynthesis cysteine-adding enzyme BshC [Flavitalea sp.]
MESTCTDLSYKETGAFSSIIIDYIEQDPQLSSFYEYPVNWDGFRESIERRRQFNTNRPLLVEQLVHQYRLTGVHEAVQQHLAELLDENTFTVCTAHQPALFTGTLYFIYKIVHTIRLADELNERFPDCNFIPVFYIGSEDADLDELGHIYLSGDTLRWNTTQTGAVGRMNTKGLEPIIQRLEGELSVLPFGAALISMIRKSYSAGRTIQEATFMFINELFADRGLVVLIPDNGPLKRLLAPIFTDDLLNQVPSSIVQSTIAELEKTYKVQASPREVNLFYLLNNSRDRIAKTGDNEWSVVGQDIRFTKEQLFKELEQYPERFSPNVILRGIFQETVLPGIAFIGGGGELAYWLELKALFNHYQVPYPVLVLRNSFLLVEDKWKHKIDKLGLDLLATFSTEEVLLKRIVQRETSNILSVTRQVEQARKVYDELRAIAVQVDRSLKEHVGAIEQKAISKIEELEKKLMRAEKRKFEAEKRQLHAIKAALFPKNNLQERVENFMPYFARYGTAFLDMIYDQSLSIDPKFRVIELQEMPVEASRKL